LSFPTVVGLGIVALTVGYFGKKQMHKSPSSALVTPASNLPLTEPVPPNTETAAPSLPEPALGISGDPPVCDDPASIEERVGDEPDFTYKFRGIVQGFRHRSEEETIGLSKQQWYVWTFRVVSFDSIPARSVAVQMRGPSFSGFIEDGDEVGLFNEWQEGKPVLAKRIYNLDRKTMVEPQEPLHKDSRSNRTS